MRLSCSGLTLSFDKSLTGAIGAHSSVRKLSGFAIISQSVICFNNFVSRRRQSCIHA